MIRIAFLFLCSLFTASCLNPDHDAQKTTGEFDVNGYFKGEINKLNRRKAATFKLAERNGRRETRLLQNPGWAGELALFSGSVINKPSWKGQYRLLPGPGQEAWYTRNPDLVTKYLRVTKNKSGTIRRIDIHNRSTNILYTSDETLTWYPDSLYVIRKWQKVRLFPLDHYLIRGLIK